MSSCYEFVGSRITTFLTDEAFVLGNWVLVSQCSCFISEFFWIWHMIV